MIIPARIARFPLLVFTEKNARRFSYSIMAMNEKRDGNEAKYPFRLFLRVRPSKDGKTELLNCLQPKDTTTLKVMVPEDSQVSIFELA